MGMRLKSFPFLSQPPMSLVRIWLTGNTVIYWLLKWGKWVSYHLGPASRPTGPLKESHRTKRVTITNPPIAATSHSCSCTDNVGTPRAYQKSQAVPHLPHWGKLNKEENWSLPKSLATTEGGITLQYQ